MNEFRFLNFKTLYKYKGKLLHSTGNGYVGNSACFNTIFSTFDAKIAENKITSYQGVELRYSLVFLDAHKEELLSSSINNKCFFNKRQLLQYIKTLVRIVDISDIRIEDIFIQRYPAFEVSFTINSRPIAHKYALFYLRRAYEFPFNMILMDVYRIRRNNPKLWRIPLQTLYSIYQLAFATPTSGHDINFGPRSFMFSNKEIRNLLDNFDFGGRSNRLDYLTGTDEIKSWVSYQKSKDFLKSISTEETARKYFSNNSTRLVKESLLGTDKEGNLENWLKPQIIEAKNNRYLEIYDIVRQHFRK